MNKKMAMEIVESLPSLYPLMTADEEEAIWTVLATNSNTENDGDCISRQTAIDAVTDELDIIDHVPQWVFDKLEKRLKQLPSAHPDNQVHLCDSCSYTYPECPSVYTDMIFGNGTGNDNICACGKYLPLTKHSTDYISRQQAIDAFNARLGELVVSGEENAKSVEMYLNKVIEKIEALPSAQPEQNLDEWCDSCKEYDKEKHSCPRWNKVIKNTVDELKSAQPEPCDDAVSRQAAIDAIISFFKLTDYNESAYAVRTVLGDLSPVTPEQPTGYWVPVGMVEAVGGESAQWGSAIAYHRCSECDEQALRDDFEQEVLSKWCPHCGVKMRGTLWK